MFVRTDYIQAFNYDGVVRKLEVLQCTTLEKDFVLLEDLRDHFDLTATRFEREDGISLTLMRDNHLQRQVMAEVLAPLLLCSCKAL